MPLSSLDKFEVSSYLAQVAAVAFYSEMEEKVQEVVTSRFFAGGDAKLANFLSKIDEKAIRRIKRPEIADTVGLFGDECRDVFLNNVPPADLETYYNVINNRHKTSHGAGSSVTINEVRDAIVIGEKILSVIETVIR